MKPAGNRAFSILELIVSLGLVSIVSTALFATLAYGFQAWRSAESRQEALAQLSRAGSALLQDLPDSSFDFVEVQAVPGLSGAQGDAVWFLSAFDPVSRRFVRSPSSGLPIWQTNVLYYLIQPLNHDGISHGVNCSPIDGGGGYDVACPHKVLIRKEIDVDFQADPLNEASQESLMTSARASSHINAPVGYNVAPQLTEVGVIPDGVRLVARDLLWFRVEKGVPGPSVVTINLRAARVNEARREVAVGSVNLIETKHTLHHLLSLVPRN